MIVVIFALLFPPVFGGGATRAMNIAKCLMNLGHEVRVIASVPHYPQGAPISRALRFYIESVEGVRVMRLPTVGLPHEGLLNRWIIYSLYALSCFVALGMCKGARKIISLGPHPFADFPSFLAKCITRGSLTVDISDLWPETVELKVKSDFLNSLFQGLGRFVNSIVLKYFSDCLSILNEPMRDFIVKHYDYNKRTFIVYNSVDTASFSFASKLNLRKENLKRVCSESVIDSFVILYHGIIGPYQKLENVIEAAAIEKKELGKALFVIIGEGEEKNKVLKLKSRMHLENVVLVGKLDRAVIRKIVVESDLGLVPIVSNNPLTMRTVMTSKALEFLAAGVPTLAPKGSFIGSVVSTAFAGFEVDFSDPRDIYEAVKISYQDRELYKAMRSNARKLAEKRFSQSHVTKMLYHLIHLCKSDASHVKGGYETP